MQFELKNAPKIIQRAIYPLHTSLEWNFVLVYLDNIVIFSQVLDDPIENVPKALMLLNDTGGTLDLKKTDSFTTGNDCFGNMIWPWRFNLSPKIIDSGYGL